jgi:hypothetical protein
VALLPDGGAAVRHSRDRISEPLMFTKHEWYRFVSGVQNGHFDL